MVSGSIVWAKDFSSWRKYSQATLVSETTSLAKGAIGTIGLKIKLEKGWHTYWLNPGDSGAPLGLKLRTSPGVKVERVLFPIPVRHESGPLISFGYDYEVLIPIELRLSSRAGHKISVEADVEWLVCEDVCIPAFDKLHLDVPVTELEAVKPSPEFELFQKTRALIPREVADFPRFEFRDQEGMLKIPQTAAEERFVEFFPFRGSGVSNVKPQLVGDVLQFEKANIPQAAAERVGVLVTRSRESGKIFAVQYGSSGWTFEVASRSATDDLLWMLLSAFLGGLILNLMPCVFPILSIKLLSLLKLARAHPREIRVQNLAYVAGVLVSFLVIALVLSALRSAGQFVGWGFQLQSPVFLALLCWLFFALSLNLLGVFEMNLLDGNVGHKLTRMGGAWGSFFTGVLAVVVASPCTAPFMGVALGFGLSQPVYVLVSVFFMLGLGLALPYLLFVFFPSFTKFLPKPGPWMIRMKQIMALPLMLTVLWLIWVLGQVRGINSILVVLAGCVVLGFALAMSRWSRSVVRILAAVLLFGGTVFIGRGESPSSADQVAHTDGLWIPYSEAQLEMLQGSNVFVNMTADWCLTCKVNERLVFADKEVQELMKSKNVKWVKGDWTKHNAEITRFLNRYDRVGVPFYVLFSSRNPSGTTLPEVLTKASFIEFLNKEFP